jgi:hypothetical protein
MLESAQPGILLIPVVSIVLAGLCLWGTYRAARRQRLVEDIPTSKTTGVFIGYVEVKGTAEAEQPLRSYLASVRCVLYQWTVQEHWSRTVTETYTDSQGRTQTRTKRESGWTTVDHGGQMIPFYLRDECGVIRISPQGATIESEKVFDETCGRSNPLYYAKGPAHAVSDSDHRRQFTEYAIELHRDLYVLGQAREREDIVAAEIAEDPCAPLFLISTRSEEQVRSGYQWAYWGWLIFGGVLAIAGWIILNLASGRPLGAAWPVYSLAAAAYLLATSLVWLWMVFNSLVELRQRVRQAWAQVDVQLKRRHDLIPNLVSIVQGLRDHEQTLQADLAELRSQLIATAPGQAGPDFHGVTRNLMAIAERYPELTAQPAFARLHESLVDTEHRIALARGYFNDIASYYNTRLERVPDRYAAALACLRPQSLLLAKDFEREPVKVALAS